jgi:hypothetical protein
VEPESPFEGESQPGKVPFQRVGQGLPPPPPAIKSRPGGFTHLSWVILAENQDSSMLGHTKGREENLPVMTQI